MENYEKIREILETILEEAKKDALKKGVDITSPEFKKVLDLIKATALKEAGTSVAEFNKIEELKQEKKLIKKKEERDNISQEIKDKTDKIEEDIKWVKAKEINWKDLKEKPDIQKIVEKITDEKIKGISRFKQSEIKDLPFSQTKHDIGDHPEFNWEIERTGKKFGKIDERLDKVEIPLSHEELLGVFPNQHHSEIHTLESHDKKSDLMKGLVQLVNGENADNLHTHRSSIIFPGAGAGVHAFLLLSDVPGSFSGQANKGVRVNSTENALEFYTTVTDTDEKVGIDSGATAGYLGAASNDGVLRTSAPLSYTDGGNYITLGIPAATNSINGYATSTQITKLDGIEDSANNYSLPTATDAILGGVKIGSRITITTGVISADVQSDVNFTSALNTKLAGIATGAEVNVQSDWDAASGDALILNKPTIPTVDDTAYDATSWDANTDAATKNTIRDKVELMLSDISANTAKVTESTTVTAPLVLTTYDISIPVATTSADGYLSQTDWDTFNNKQSTLVADTDYLTPGTAASTYAVIAQTFYIGTTQVAINRSSGALTLAGLTLTTPDIGTPSAGVLTSCTGLPAAAVVAGSLVANMLASDHGTAATDQIINVSYGTGDPPTANTTTEGSLFIKYTA